MEEEKEMKREVKFEEKTLVRQYLVHGSDNHEDDLTCKMRLC